MVTRICISINNRCNLNCSYCHFHEKQTSIKENDMNVYQILDNVKSHIDKYKIEQFKIGFVGNGEPLLDFQKLCDYLSYIRNYLKSGNISAYTITNGTVVDKEKLALLKDYNVNVGFSIDGIKSVHDKLRCKSYDIVMESICLYHEINGFYPSMNCTVGKEVLNHSKETIKFFEQFNNRITFSRMIGKNGISTNEFNNFIEEARKTLCIRTGGYDCTMYGGKCGAGINNYYFANGKVYICGNCIDTIFSFDYGKDLDLIDFSVPSFNRNFCFKESVLQ